MQLKILEVVAPRGHADAVIAIAADAAADWTVTDLVAPKGPEPGDGDDRPAPLVQIRILCGPAARQAVIDRIQTVLAGTAQWRLTILPVDASLPELQPDAAPDPARDPDAADAAERHQAVTATREELYGAVAGGAVLDSNFLIFLVLATLVAGLGLIADNVAVIIGAMVIAPLLGPSLAFALATALGDRALMLRALGTGTAGLGLAIALSALLTLVVPVPADSVEIHSRTEIGYGSVALALASGAAAALSLTAGLPMTLVGVMVAVALLPPAATVGLMLGTGAFGPALGAAMLLAVNLIAVNLMGQLVFLMRGIRPHRWLSRGSAQQSAQQSMGLSIAVSSALLAAIIALIAIGL